MHVKYIITQPQHSPVCVLRSRGICSTSPSVAAQPPRHSIFHSSLRAAGAFVALARRLLRNRRGTRFSIPRFARGKSVVGGEGLEPPTPSM